MKIPAPLLDQLQEAATLAGTDYRDLLICYAREGLINTGAQLKRGQFVEHVRDFLKKHGVQTNAIEEIFKKIFTERGYRLLCGTCHAHGLLHPRRKDAATL